jgi:SPP1 family predicted phage head-tail adaptor
MDAGKLRHRVDFERRINTQDPVTGEVVPVWQKLATAVPASIEPLSAREFLAAKSLQSEVTTRIVVRYRAGLNAAMRIKHGSRIYNPEGFLADPITGLEYLTIPCSEGVNEG